MILNDKQIARLCSVGTDADMIYPFHAESMKYNEMGIKVPSYGVSSFGYDIRLDNKFIEFKPYSRFLERDAIHDLRDVENISTPDYQEYVQSDFIIEPNETILGCSMETFNMPDDVLALCLGKSSYARIGLFVNVTPLEPSWKGTLTIELSNLGTRRLRVHAGDGIAQLVFLRGERPNTTYADKHGKYQDQEGVTLGKL